MGLSIGYLSFLIVVAVILGVSLSSVAAGYLWYRFGGFVGHFLCFGFPSKTKNSTSSSNSGSKSSSSSDSSFHSSSDSEHNFTKNASHSCNLIYYTFALIGYVVRGVGRVNQDHIAIAEHYMHLMQLDTALRKKMSVSGVFS